MYFGSNSIMVQSSYRGKELGVELIGEK